MLCLIFTLGDQFRPINITGDSPKGLLVVAELDLICVLDEVDPLALDLFAVDQGPYLCLEVLDGDSRSAFKIGLQGCEVRARATLQGEGGGISTRVHTPSPSVTRATSIIRCFLDMVFSCITKHPAARKVRRLAEGLRVGSF